jgi:hypothetical protein
VSAKSLGLVLNSDEEILIRAFRACTHDNQEHLFWLALKLSRRPLTSVKSAEVILLADPLRKFP